MRSSTALSFRARPLMLLTGLFACLTLLALAFGAAPASAHNTLQSTDPEDGATLEVAPDHIALTFDDKVIEVGSVIEVNGPDGENLADGDVVIEHNVVTQALTEDRPAGTYEVLWRVTSADGHPIDGQFSFTTETAAGAPEPSEAPSESPSTEASESPTTSAAPSPETSPTADASASDDASDSSESGGLSTGLLVAIIVIAIAAGAAVVVVINKRRSNDA